MAASVGSQLSQRPWTTTVLPRNEESETLSSGRRFINSDNPQPFPPLLREKTKHPQVESFTHRQNHGSFLGGLRREALAAAFTLRRAPPR